MSTADQQDFRELVNRAMADPALASMRPAVEKELLHYDVLFALDKERLLDELVFQGGTSLRLCHGANRFSEDLDFVGGATFTSAKLAEIKDCIEHYIGERYQLDVSVKEPSSLRQGEGRGDVTVDKWQISIATTPERKDLPNQRIKLEVANIEALSTTRLPLRRNYDFLPDGYEDILMSVESLDEIMADKLVSLPATEKYVRHRDVWDLAWLTQHSAQPDVEMVESKVAAYGVDDYPAEVEAMIKRLPEIVVSKAFHDEMSRFLPSTVIERTLSRNGFTDYLCNTVSGLLSDVDDQMRGQSSRGSSFSM